MTLMRSESAQLQACAWLVQQVRSGKLLQSLSDAGAESLFDHVTRAGDGVQALKVFSA